MAIVSIIGHKGGVGKTTLAINIAAALTKALHPTHSENQVCLFDLDLRVPTITGILNSHPQKTFYDLFETLANRTYQVEFLQTLYGILVRFKGHIDGDTTPQNRPQLQKSITMYKNLNIELFNFSRFEFGDQLHELFLARGDIHSSADLKKKVICALNPLIVDHNRQREVRQPIGTAASRHTSAEKTEIRIYCS